ncbi:hypothetical protein FDECE_18069 [Fusarium decemcellulare]|nr:hypothetical protein FDECE_18069 [Fusarium decemcellulare]
MAGQASTTIDGGIPWDHLIEFANQKKAEEQRTGLPAVLNNQQSAAISQLIPLVSEPEVEDKWVGTLNQYCQQKSLGNPVWLSETFNLDVYGVPQARSRVRCKLPWCDKEFPQEGFGYEAGEEPPSFKKAQKAKHFAAMHAYTWIQGNTSPRGSKRPASMTQTSPSRTRVKAEDDNSDGGVSTAGPSGIQEGNASTQSHTIRERVAVLVTRLGFGLPEYEIERDGDALDTWQGRPIFRNDGRIPEDVGVVRGVVGRQQAEDAVAEKLLHWLEKEEQVKHEECEKAMKMG